MNLFALGLYPLSIFCLFFGFFIGEIKNDRLLEWFLQRAYQELFVFRAGFRQSWQAEGYKQWQISQKGFAEEANKMTLEQSKEVMEIYYYAWGKLDSSCDLSDLAVQRMYSVILGHSNFADSLLAAKEFRERVASYLS